MRPAGSAKSTWPLWFGSAAILLIAAASLGLFLRRRSGSTDTPIQLAAEEEAAA